MFRNDCGGTQGGGGAPPLNAGPGRREGRVSGKVQAGEEERPTPPAMRAREGGGESPSHQVAADRAAMGRGASRGGGEASPLTAGSGEEERAAVFRRHKQGGYVFGGGLRGGGEEAAGPARGTRGGGEGSRAWSFKRQPPGRRRGGCRKSRPRGGGRGGKLNSVSSSPKRLRGPVG